MARRRGDDGSEELRPSGVRRVRAVDDEKSRFASIIWTVVPFLLIIALYVICYMWGTAHNNAAEDIGSWESAPTQESTMPKAGETLSTGEPSEVLPGDGASSTTSSGTSSSTTSSDATTSGSTTSGTTSNTTSGATSSDGTSGTSSTSSSGREISTSSSGYESSTSGTSSGSRQTSVGSSSGSTSQDDGSSYVPTQDELRRD